MSESLTRKVLKGGFWTFGLRVTSRLIGLARTVFLARLLVPDDFGLLGIAMLSIATLETFTKTGLHEALVQRKGNVSEYLDTVWTITVIRGILLFALLYTTAPIIADFFQSANATPVIRITALTLLLTSFTNIKVIYFQKSLEFHKLYLYDISGIIVDFIISIILAITLRNVLALVFGGLAGSFVRLAVSYAIAPYRPRPTFAFRKTKELLHFGKWVFGSSLIGFLITQGDDIFVGKLLGIPALGLYQMAYLLSNLPATEISHVVSNVTFPAYATHQHDLSKLRSAFLDVYQLCLLVLIPVAGGIFILGAPFTQLFLGSKWQAMVPALQILSWYGLLRATGAMTGPLFQASGNPHITTKLQLLKLLFLGMFIVPLTLKMGLTGAAMACLVSSLIVNPIAMYRTAKLLSFSLSSIIRRTLSPVLSLLVMGVALYILQQITIGVISWFTFGIQIVIGCVVYISTIYALNHPLKYGLKELLHRRMIANPFAQD